MADQIIVHAGNHPRIHCPVRVRWPWAEAPDCIRLGGNVLPVQRDGDYLVFISIPLDPGDRALYLPSDTPGSESLVSLAENEGGIRVEVDGEELTTYRFQEVLARPYFWPVLAPGGIPVTRAYPMKEGVAGETQDHPHHRSLYTAFGSVNGVDNWSEEPGHGFTVHKSIEEMTSGPVFGRFATTSDWTDAEGRTILTQKLVATFWGGTGTPAPPDREAAMERAQELGVPYVDLSKFTPEKRAVQMVPEHLARRHNVIPIKYRDDRRTLYVATANPGDAAASTDLRLASGRTIRAVMSTALDISNAIDRVYAGIGAPQRPVGLIRMFDLDLSLIATKGDVLFGDTKEGGMVSIRVATSMDVSRGGRIENSYGGINEAETWGRAAHWCDYSGDVGGHRVGIAVMDHPSSFRYPTYWHVRDYGLMAANPFAMGDYTKGEKDGSHLLRAGETLRFLHRVLVHTGDALAADVRNQYLSFVSPPRVEVKATDDQ